MANQMISQLDPLTDDLADDDLLAIVDSSDLTDSVDGKTKRMDAQQIVAKKLKTITGPTVLAIGAVADGEFLKRSGSTIVSDTVVGAGGGYINIPQNSQSANYTTVLADQGKHIFHPASDNNPRTFTIPANASVAFPIGTAISFVNKVNTLTIAITSDTLTWAKDGSAGSRTLAANGIATALKIDDTEWLISGEGIS